MKKVKNMSPSRFIAIGYIVVILLGALLLSLPISSKERIWTSFIDALFTATTSTCVTGLVVFDTYTHWSIFGQIVILLLIQIGGIGFMTVISLTVIFVKKKVNFRERKLLMQSSGSIKLNDTLHLMKKIVIGTLVFEVFGALMLLIRFAPMFGFGKGLYYAFFHSISAFCNAGIDIMGVIAPYSSFTSFQSDLIVNITLMILIIMGGLGFLVWSDIINSKFKFKKMQLHSRIVIVITSLLIIIPAILFFVIERDNPDTLKGMNNMEAILAALFQSVTTRTAGFNTISIDKLKNASSLLTMILMFIGGSPASTAGGIKTTTFVVLMFSIAFSFKQTTDITIGKKQLERSILKQACAILVLYLSAVLFGAFIVMAVEDFSMKDTLFEVVSAIGTVGLSTGITSGVSFISKVVLILLMYIGRMGALSIILLFKNDKNDIIERPIEKIVIG